MPPAPPQTPATPAAGSHPFDAAPPQAPGEPDFPLELDETVGAGTFDDISWPASIQPDSVEHSQELGDIASAAPDHGDGHLSTGSGAAGAADEELAIEQLEAPPVSPWSTGEITDVERGGIEGHGVGGTHDSEALADDAGAPLPEDDLPTHHGYAPEPHSARPGSWEDAYTALRDPADFGGVGADGEILDFVESAADQSALDVSAPGDSGFDLPPDASAVAETASTAPPVRFPDDYYAGAGESRDAGDEMSAALGWTDVDAAGTDAGDPVGGLADAAGGGEVFSGVARELSDSAAPWRSALGRSDPEALFSEGPGVADAGESGGERAGEWIGEPQAGSAGHGAEVAGVGGVAGAAADPGAAVAEALARVADRIRAGEVVLPSDAAGSSDEGALAAALAALLRGPSRA